MDQGADYIRQDIDSTRAALDEKLDTLETKARQTFDLRHHMDEHPWMLMGGAFAAGYVVGSMGSADDDERQGREPSATTGYNVAGKERSGESRSEGLLSQFDDEINMLKTAAVSTIVTLLRDSIRTYVPAMGQQLDRVAQEQGKRYTTSSGSAAQPTTSPYGSFSEATAYGSSAPQSEHERAVGNQPNR